MRPSKYGSSPHFFNCSSTFNRSAPEAQAIRPSIMPVQQRRGLDGAGDGLQALHQGRVAALAESSPATRRSRAGRCAPR
jgi:hypothetical protein